MESERMVHAFGALSDTTRLKIILFLSDRQKNSSGICNNFTEEEICFHIAGKSSKFTTITHHLHELEAAGLITIGRKNNLVTCSLRAYMFEALAAELIAIGT